MPAPIPLADHKQQVNVRFEAATRHALEEYAAASDRTISQLVRYATDWWLAEGTHVCPLPPAPAAVDQPGRHVNVRFAPETIEALHRAAQAMHTDRSGVIRCAVRAWLESVSPEALGHPSVAVRVLASTPPGVAV